MPRLATRGHRPRNGTLAAKSRRRDTCPRTSYKPVTFATASTDRCTGRRFGV